MATTVTVWDGAGVIGGNKILVEDAGTAFLLDFGTSFATRGRYYEEFLKPRGPRGLLDPLVMELLPPLQGIYRSDLEPPGEDLWARVPPQATLDLAGVLLSHAHLDHTGALSFLRDGVPILTGAMTAVICKAVQDCGQSDFEQEVCYLVPREENEGMLTMPRGQPALQRPFQLVEDARPTAAAEAFWSTSYTSREIVPQPLLPTSELSGIPVKRFPVDHSVFGASAFAVETSAGWVVYTGDLRCHGRAGEDTRRFAQQAAQLEPVLLICEGTHVERDVCATEAEVYDNALACLEGADGKLVIADFGARNVERLLTFLRIAEDRGRRLVVSAKDAFLLDAMRCVSDKVPDLSAEASVAVYRDPKLRPGGWEKAVYETHSEKLMSPAQVHAEQGEVILCFSFFDLNDLVDINPDPGGIYIYSSSEAYTEEQRIDFGRLRNWLGRFGMTMRGDPQEGLEKPLHASGHISGRELLELIRTTAPKRLLPVHTEDPVSFTTNLAREMGVLIPTRGQTMTIG